MGDVETQQAHEYQHISYKFGDGANVADCSWQILK